MDLVTEIERQFWLFISLTGSLILFAHAFVHFGVKWSDKRYRATRKAKAFKVTVISGDEKQWCSMYKGKTIVVKPLYNSQGEEIDFLYTVISCRENKKVLSDDEWLSTKYPNAWGFTLSVRKENVSPTN